MHRKSFPLPSLLFLLLLSGCSSSSQFVVINASSGTIAVQYRLKNWVPVTPGTKVNIQVPAKVSLDEFQEAEYRWRTLEREEYLLDKVTGTVVVNVSPGEVLLVDQITNYRDDADQFGLASIKISGPSGSVQFEGEQARTQFIQEGRSKYIVRYW